MTYTVSSGTLNPTQLLSHLLGGNICTVYRSLESPARFPICHNLNFSLSVAVETLQAEICGSRRFSKGVGHFEAKF